MDADLLTDVLLDRVDPQALIKLATQVKWAEPLSTKDIAQQVLQYGGAGMAAGGIGSLIRSAFSNPDPDIEGSAKDRLLRALSIGGLSGAGVAGGSAAMGYKLPALQDMVRGGQVAKSPRWQTSAGIGVLGGAGAVGLGALARRRAVNRTLGGNIGRLADDARSSHLTSYRRDLPNVFGAKTPADKRTAIQRGIDFILSRSNRVRNLHREMGELEYKNLQGQDLPTSQYQELINKHSKPDRPVLGSPAQHMILGGATTGVLHQMLGRE